MGKYIMAMDQGTTSSRCILFDKAGNICSSAQKEFAQYYPKPGWVEHDPHEIWSSQMAVAIEAMGKIGADAGDIAAIGITNQRETTIVWDKKTGNPVYPAIVWQCRRTSDMIEELKQDGFADKIREKTGLKLNGKEIFARERAGETVFKEIVEEWIDYLTDGLSTITYIFNPSLIVIGGGVTKQGDYLLERVNKSLTSKIGVNYKKNLSIRFAELGNNAGMLGAVYLLLKKIGKLQ